MRAERRQHHHPAARHALVGPTPEPGLVTWHKRIDEYGCVGALVQDRADMLVPIVGAIRLGIRRPSCVRGRPSPKAWRDLLHPRTLPSRPGFARPPSRAVRYAAARDHSYAAIPSVRQPLKTMACTGPTA